MDSGPLQKSLRKGVHSLASLLPCKGTVFIPSGARPLWRSAPPVFIPSEECSSKVPFWKQGAVVIRHRICQCLHLALPSLQNYENKLLLFINYPVSCMLSQQHKWTKKELITKTVSIKTAAIKIDIQRPAEENREPRNKSSHTESNDPQRMPKSVNKERTVFSINSTRKIRYPHAKE